MKKLLNKIPVLGWALSMKGEIALVIIALIGFAHLAGWMRFFDDTSAPMDIGILSAVAVGVVAVISGIFLFWTLWRVCFPKEIDDWFDCPFDGDEHGFLADWSKASPAVRLILFFGTLWAVLLSIGLTVMALR